MYIVNEDLHRYMYEGLSKNKIQTPLGYINKNLNIFKHNIGGYKTNKDTFLFFKNINVLLAWYDKQPQNMTFSQRKS